MSEPRKIIPNKSVKSGPLSDSLVNRRRKKPAFSSNLIAHGSAKNYLNRNNLEIECQDNHVGATVSQMESDFNNVFPIYEVDMKELPEKRSHVRCFESRCTPYLDLSEDLSATLEPLFDEDIDRLIQSAITLPNDAPEAEPFVWDEQRVLERFKLLQKDRPKQRSVSLAFKLLNNDQDPVIGIRVPKNPVQANLVARLVYDLQIKGKNAGRPPGPYSMPKEMPRLKDALQDDWTRCDDDEQYYVFKLKQIRTASEPVRF